MAVSRRPGWIAAGLLARLLMVVVLLMSVRFVLANYIHWDYTQGTYKLQSYTYESVSDCPIPHASFWVSAGEFAPAWTVKK